MTRTSAGSEQPTEASITSHPSLDRSRFVPGAVLDKRYRIVGLLGRGGMGEVYRADDMKLGQPVALKFLPEGLERDESRLNRFLNEVRTARQVTHPSVCRVFDIDEVDGQHYLSMEYVDGEDLSSLLRRIGRLPRDKAMQIARQLCAGVQAAHEQGILHRDLKPANVMIDGRGQVKITDFGLAGLEETIQDGEIRSGTPAYMAPEQLAGKEVTVRSDIYALGLVLYELFTGKQAFEAGTPTKLVRLQQDSAPTNPSSHVEGFDPAVERVILRCLEKEPHDRPASALAVAAALPGGDPLAAALAAGETPSPEMVADAGHEGGLAPSVAVPCLLVFLIALGGAAYLNGEYSLLGRVPLEKPAQALADRAGEMAARFGYVEPPRDTAYTFFRSRGLLEHIRDNDDSASRWERLARERPSAIGFAYRRSPRPLVAQNPWGRVTWWDPPILYSGMVNVELDSAGRLTKFHAVPPHREEESRDVEEAAAFDWGPVFEEAGLDPADFTAVRPLWIAESYCENRVAWTGTYPDQAEPEVRVEGCELAGRLVYFEMLFPWDRPWRMETREAGVGEKIQAAIGMALFVGTILGGCLLARRNLLLGRGDRKGAFRLALFIFALGMLVWLLGAHHVSSAGDEIGMFVQVCGVSLFSAAFVWIVYVALEPFVRRRWPDTLVSWARVLAGRVRDPLVARHVLYGGAIGAVLALVGQLAPLAPGWLGWPPATPPFIDLRALEGARQVAASLVTGQFVTIFMPMVFLFLIVLLRVLLRVEWVAFVAFVALMALGALPGPATIGYPLLDVALSALFAAAILFCLVRFGLVAAMAYFFFASFMAHYPITLDFSTWYAGASVVCLLGPVGVVAYGFYLSLAGRGLLREALVEG